MTETVISTILTFEIRANVTPQDAVRQTVDDITIKGSYNENIPLLRYYAADIIKDLVTDQAELITAIEKRHPDISTSPKITLTKRLIPPKKRKGAN